MPYLRKRGKSWYYTIETKNPDGSRKQMERVGGKTKKEALIAYAEYMSSLENTWNVAFDNGDILFADFLDFWVTNYVEINLKENTILSYRQKIRDHIIPELGEYKVKKISPLILQKFINEKKQNYSLNTLKIFYTILKESLKYAIHPAEIISNNPAQYLRLPKYDETKNRIKIFDEQQICTIFKQFSKGHDFYIPISLAYYTGMRLGECLALKWDDVNLTEMTIHVQSTKLDKTGVSKIAKTPKTSSSDRIIIFSEQLYNLLYDHKNSQASQKIKYGEFYNSTNFICTKADGSPLSSNDIRYFGKWCKKALGNGSFHTLRHTHATMLLENGVDLEYVSKRLGHSSIVITADHYSHITAKRHQTALNLMNKIL